MRKDSNLAILKRIAKAIYKNRLSMFENERSLLLSTIDSFLMFASTELKDNSVYPYWSTLDFESLDDFITFLIHWDRYLGFISPADNMFIKTYINNNPNNVWDHLMNFPKFNVVTIDETEKAMVWLWTVNKIICVLCDGSLSYEIKMKSPQNLTNLVVCSKFADYLVEVWDEVSSAIKSGCVSGVRGGAYIRGILDKNFFSAKNKRKVLGELRKIRYGGIKTIYGLSR